jgi:hypothetical protein
MTQTRVRFEFIPVSAWPQLGWLAQCHRHSDVVTVFHGTGVETTPEWFAEATWADEFGEGAFDKTDVVAGSGGRIRGSDVTFVSSASTVDRLQSMQRPDGAWVSNSLACLLEAADARIDESSSLYPRLFRTVVRGVNSYRRDFPTFAGPVMLTYFHNLVWNGRELMTRPKPRLHRDFSTFDQYASFMRATMQAIAANAAAPSRRRTYSLLSTLSSGYDSSTAAVLAREAGAPQVLSFEQARLGLNDTGEPLARALGLQTVVVPRSDWMSQPLPEVRFVASDSHGGDVFFSGAGAMLAGKVLLTGYHGDKAWAKDPHCPLNDQIVRGDQSGLSLSEYRLDTGMLHCPIAFWGIRQIADINAISNSPDMRPWDVPGDYSRPICRRIVESAGVPRDAFGMEKKATWVLLQYSSNFLSPSSMQDYLQWLREHRGAWIRRGRVPPSLDRRVDKFELQVRTAFGRFGQDDPAAWYKALMRRTGLMRGVWRVAETPSRLRRFVFPWALAHRRRAYPRPF